MKDITLSAGDVVKYAALIAAAAIAWNTLQVRQETLARETAAQRERLRVLERIAYEQFPEYTASIVEATRGDH